MREGVARIYISISDDNGDTWPAATQEISAAALVPQDTLQHFHPQLAAAGNRVFGCAFYQYDPTLSPPKIDVRIAPLWPGGAQFEFPKTVTDMPWDPTINPPTAHNTTTVTFIGDYFGIGAGKDFFELVWTDTRTRTQELFSAPVRAEVHPDTIAAGARRHDPRRRHSGGGGFVIVGGHIIRIPPWDPRRRHPAGLSAPWSPPARSAAVPAVLWSSGMAGHCLHRRGERAKAAAGKAAAPEG